MCRINPRVDFAFKKLFGTEENKELLIDFINSIVSEKDQVMDLELKNPYSIQSFKAEKQSILDIKAQDSEGKWFNIEMQIIDQDYFDKRALYYWSKLYTEQLTSGMRYDKLTKTIGINILNFNCLEEAAYHNCYRLQNVESGKEYLDHIELHFIELGKYDESLVTMLDRWTNFLKKAEMYEKKNLPQELKEVASIRKAIDILETMGLDPEERNSYDASVKLLMDEESRLATAERKGLEQGLEQGIEIGARQAKLELAKGLLEILDVETVALKTGLSQADVELLSKEK